MVRWSSKTEIDEGLAMVLWCALKEMEVFEVTEDNLDEVVEVVRDQPVMLLDGMHAKHFPHSVVKAHIEPAVGFQFHY